ncbi:MAG TPA: SDR family oxidoreductase, partial [Bacteroidia bacterium]|nr:SDR family oxidoreductase [Bacteroidia bacterium]
LIENKKINAFEGDIRDIEVVKKALNAADVLIHLAGMSDGRMGKKNPKLTKEVNFNSFENILVIARQSGVKRVLFASTSGVYGNKYNETLTEYLKPDPADPYSESKLNCEKMLSSYSDNCFTTCSVRSAMVYGSSPNMRFDFLINQLIKIAIEKSKLSILGGTQKRPQIHINDLSDVFLKLITVNSNSITKQSFNAVTFNPTVLDLAKAIKELIPATEIEILPPRKGEETFELDGSKLSNVIGPYHKTSLTEGIEEIILKLKANEMD